ncbi:hypothetical protein HDV00_003448 [Rhizophlyctis rosea]|nr:hypothetical protein HDV00_003448 [Rhizophlyctis rosea]
MERMTATDFLKVDVMRAFPKREATPTEKYEWREAKDAGMIGEFVEGHFPDRPLLYHGGPMTHLNYILTSGIHRIPQEVTQDFGPSRSFYLHNDWELAVQEAAWYGRPDSWGGVLVYEGFRDVREMEQCMGKGFDLTIRQPRAQDSE